MPSSGGRDDDIPLEDGASVTILLEDGAPVTPPEPWRVGTTRSIRWLLSPSPACLGRAAGVVAPTRARVDTGHTQVYLGGDVPTASYSQLHSFHLRVDGPMGYDLPDHPRQSLALHEGRLRVHHLDQLRGRRRSAPRAVASGDLSMRVPLVRVTPTLPPRGE